MKDSGIADTMLILPEFEFHLFDNVGWEVQANHIGMHLDVDQSYWAFYVNDAYATSGVDVTPIEAGAKYAFKVEK